MAEKKNRKRRREPDQAPIVDLDVEDHGSVVLLRPLNDAASAWMREKCEAPAWAWTGGALAVDHRMVMAIVEGARSDGFEVRGVAL